MPARLIDFNPSLRGMALEKWLKEVADLVSQDGSLKRLGARHFSAFTRQKDTLIVSFESFEGIMALSPLAQPIGWDLTRGQGWSSLSMVSTGDTWFRDPAVYDYFDRLDDSGFFDSFARVVFYGAGAAAYAAAAFSAAAPGARVLAVQPQATLDPARAGWDTRFPHMRRTDFNGRFGYAPEMLDAASRAYIVYDPLEREDAMHATLFDKPHITHLTVRGMGAALQSDLWQMQVLHKTIAAVAADQLTPVAFARSLRARRTHLPYLHRLLRRLEAEDRAALIAMLCRNVTSHIDAPRFRKRLVDLQAAQ